MSTKIHNGYYIDKCSLGDLQAFCMKLREQVKPVFEKLYATKVLKEGTDLFDDKSLLEAGLYVRNDLTKKTLKCIDNTEYSPLLLAKWEVDERSDNIKKTMVRDVDYDFDFNIALIPTADKILAMTFTEQEELRNVFTSFPNVHEYRYFNNSDKPKEIVGTEWEQREKDWDNVDIPAMCGFSVQCTPVYPPYLTWEELYSLAEHPAYEGRVKHHTFNILLKQYVEENNITNIRMSEWINIIDGTHEWIKSEAGQQKKVETEKKVRAVLKEGITLEDLI